jgi:phage terminase large subunit GpA-like protein
MSLSDEYIAYLHSEEWKRYKKAFIGYWQGRCALCNSEEPLEVHHRTYERIGFERYNDCIALCPSCHKMADAMRKKAMANATRVPWELPS